MNYISTRGQAPALGFEDVLLAGLAADGGLYVPQRWPRLEERTLASAGAVAYPRAAAAVMGPLVGEAMSRAELEALCDAAYARFRDRNVAPLVQIGPGQWLMELYHGPTLAFKDVAMQVLGRLYDRALRKRGRRITIVGATSGDTGSAAIEAIKGREHADIFIMHPRGRTSAVQRRQMTTVDAPNVHNIAVEGTFDDCQSLLKAMFADAAFREEVSLSGVNSINWARIAPQVVYYVVAAALLGGAGSPEAGHAGPLPGDADSRESPAGGERSRGAVRFTVPTGNFGDIFAGYVAGQMGANIARLTIATNLNDILARALETGEHKLGRVEPTMSPSMDIQVSSNFERLLFEIHGRDPRAVAAKMEELRDRRAFTIQPEALTRIRERFSAHRVDEAQTLETIGRVYQDTGRLIDPHTAVGVAAARREPASPVPMVVLATAHPAKFPDAVEKATGIRPPLPPALADLHDLPEHYVTLPNDLAAVQAHIRQALAPAGNAKR